MFIVALIFCVCVGLLLHSFCLELSPTELIRETLMEVKDLTCRCGYLQVTGRMEWEGRKGLTAPARMGWRVCQILGPTGFEWLHRQWTKIKH